MSTPFNFLNPAGELAGTKAFGSGGPPSSGYYCVKIDRLEATDKPASGKMILTIPTLAEFNQAAHDGDVWSWWNNTIPNPSNDPEIAKNNEKAKKGQRSVLESLGYEGAVIDAAAVHPGWLLHSQCQRYAYIAYVAPQQGVQGSNPQVDFITKEKFLAGKASGVAPERRVSGNAAGGAAPPPVSAPPPPAAGSMPPPPPAAPGVAQAPPAAPPPPPAAAPGFAPPPPPPR